MGDRRVVLVWRKRLWRCPEPACAAKTWSEETDAIAPRAVLTERARVEICRRVGRDGHSVAQLAREFGVSWHPAMEAVRDHGRPRVDHLSRLRLPAAIGIDETSFLAANAQHSTPLVTGFVDLDRHRASTKPGAVQAALSLSLGYVTTTSLLSWRPSCWTHSLNRRVRVMRLESTAELWDHRGRPGGRQGETMESFEQFVAVAMEAEGLIVSRL